MKEALTTCHEYNIPEIILFIDSKKVYDSIKRKFNVLPKLVRLVKLTLNRTTNNVRI